MKLATAVTLFVGSVLLLANSAIAADVPATTPLSTSAPTQTTVQTAIQSVTTKPVKKAASSPTYGVFALLSRSTSLVDFQDGTRADNMDILLSPSVKLSAGRLSAVMTYSQNLRDDSSQTENDFGDIPVTFAFKAKPLGGYGNYDTSLAYSITAIAPVSKISTKKDQLQTSLSGKVSWSLGPKEDGVSLLTSLSAGRNFHAYEEDINGNVLNQYSSNQQIKVGYVIGNWSVSADFIHKSRWTYKGNIKGAFELTEEIEYAINKNYAVALGHTNAGSVLKPNGTDTNIDLYNENNSVIYGTLTLSYM